MRRLIVLAVAAAGLSGGAASAHCYGQQNASLPRAGACGGLHCSDLCYWEEPYCFLDLTPGRTAFAICRSNP